MRSDFSKYFLIIMSFVFLGYLINAYFTKREATQTGISEERNVNKCTRDDFEVSEIQWQKASQDAVGEIEALTVTNKGEYDCKDLKGIIQFLSHDGTELDKSDFVISEKIHSKETKTFQGIPLKQPTAVHAQDASVTIKGVAEH